MNRLIILCVFLCCGLSWLSAQSSTDQAIKNAQSTVANVRTDAKKLPGPKDSIRWKLGGDLSAGFSQNSFTHWAKGGENNFHIRGAANLFANYRKNKIVWENYATLVYAQMAKGESKPQKMEDKIELLSKLGYQTTEKLFCSSALLAKTQFAPGYKYGKDTTKVSNFIAPVQLFLSVGVDIKSVKNLSVMLSPAMGRAIYVNSDDLNIQRNAGLTKKIKVQDELGNWKDKEVGERSKYEIGGGLLVKYGVQFFEKKWSVDSQLELFSNYASDPACVDVFWKLSSRFNLHKYITANFNVDMQYDDDQRAAKDRGPTLQIKESFTINLTYTF